MPAEDAHDAPARAHPPQNSVVEFWKTILPTLGGLKRVVSRPFSERPQWLTLGHVFRDMHIRQCSLAVLNGCESGMVRPHPVDEYIGLASGFLYAGATCVLSTLWAVHDLSSALLALKFHELWRSGRSAGTALAQAQRWLRHIPSGVEIEVKVLPWLLDKMEADAGLELASYAVG